MTDNGAYDNEMSFFDGPTLDDPELAAFAGSVRASLIAPAPPGRQAAFVSLLAEEARLARAEGATAVREPARPSRRRLRLVAQACLALVLVPLAGAGLAVAGVKLPGPAQSAFETIGVDLPNQQRGSSEAEPVADPAATEPEGATGEPQVDDVGGAGANDRPAKADKANPKDGGRGNSEGNGDANRSPSGTGPSQSPSNSGAANGNGRGKSEQAPGQSGSAGNAGGNGRGKAIGRTEAVPPGQAKKPASPGNSAEAKGKSP